MPFDGETYEPQADRKRLTRQLDCVRSFLLSRHGQWFTLRELSDALEKIYQRPFPEASTSARIRDLRKQSYGRFKVDRRRRAEGGTWEYRLDLKGTQVEFRL